jgi:adenylate cyclase
MHHGNRASPLECPEVLSRDLWSSLLFPDSKSMLNRKMERRFSAILAVDVVGYTRLMEVDEYGTHQRFMRLRERLLDPTIARYAGRLIKHTGDGFLASFDNTVEAVRCAVFLQETLVKAGANDSPSQRIAFRMGLHACDAIIEKDDVYGEGVNIAARLQNYAEPGDIVVSAMVFEQLGTDFDHIPRFDLGDIYLKNISQPVRATGLRIGSIARDASVCLSRAADDRPSIAVLPFRKIQPKARELYFADGIVEEIIHALASLEELFVISRTSTLRYSGSDLDAREIGRELGVRYLLYGSVRRSGRHLRICTELSDAESGRIIHSDEYDGELRDLFHLQARIATEVLKRIAPHFREWELRRVLRKHPESLTAHDFVLQALFQLVHLDYVSHSKARGLLQQAIGTDPGYGLAYTYLAYWHIFRIGEGWSSNPDMDAAEAARIASVAIECDPNDALALAIYGHVQSFLLKDYNTALNYLDRAVEVGPNCANAWTMSSATLGFIGEGGKAIERAEKGLRLSPFDAHIFWHEALLAQAYYIDGQYEAAVAWARKAASHKATAIFNLRTLAASLIALGRDVDAHGVAQQLLHVQPKFNLITYAPRCPFIQPIRETWIERLHRAGLPAQASCSLDQ